MTVAFQCRAGCGHTWTAPGVQRRGGEIAFARVSTPLGPDDPTVCPNCRRIRGLVVLTVTVEQPTLWNA